MSASPIREPFTLETGFVIGGARYRSGALRPAALADAYQAAALVDVPGDISSNRPARIAYQMAVDDAQILAQVACIDGLDAPPPLAALVAAIDPDDMARLREAAVAVKKKRQALKAASPIGDEPKSSSSAPASA